MKRVRQLHFWLGMFLAPSLLLFAFTGALQVFGLHEDGAPAFVSKLAQVHMKQSIADRPARPERPPAPEPSREARAPGGERAPAARAPRARLHSSAPYKWFLLFVCLGLFVSTGLGIYMAIRYRRDRRVVFGLLFAGCAVPVILLMF